MFSKIPVLLTRSVRQVILPKSQKCFLKENGEQIDNKRIFLATEQKLQPWMINESYKGDKKLQESNKPVS